MRHTAVSDNRTPAELADQWRIPRGLQYGDMKADRLGKACVLPGRFFVALTGAVKAPA